MLNLLEPLIAGHQPHLNARWRSNQTPRHVGLIFCAAHVALGALEPDDVIDLDEAALLAGRTAPLADAVRGALAECAEVVLVAAFFIEGGVEAAAAGLAHGAAGGRGWGLRVDADREVELVGRRFEAVVARAILCSCRNGGELACTVIATSQ